MLDHLSDHVKKKQTSLALMNNASKQSQCVFKSHAHGNLAEFFVGTNSSTEYALKLFADAKIIYVVRDGRDVMVSLYHYMSRYNAEVREKSFAEFVRMVNNADCGTYPGALDRVEYWAYHVGSWISRPGTLVVRYEDFHQQYGNVVNGIASFVGCDRRKRLRNTVRSAPVPFVRFLGLLRLRIPFAMPWSMKSTAVSYRSGRIGDWRAHFTTKDLEYFTQRAGSIMDELGYAND